jgi:alpha-beta hydrolase superfamily lysophospholipase
MLAGGRPGPVTQIALVCVAACCALWPIACGGSGTDDGAMAGSAQRDAGPEPVRAVFKLTGLPMAFGSVPWPDDAYVEAGRILTRDIPTQGPPDFADALADGLSDIDGFGIRPTIYFRFDGELDPDSLPATPDDSVKSDASAFLIDLDVGSPDAFERIALDVRYDARRSEVRMRPANARALVPGRLYAAVVTRSVLGADGRAVEPASAFTRLRTAQPRDLDAKQRHARAAYVPVLDTLAGIGLARDRVAALAVFHVQTTRADLSDARKEVREVIVPSPAITQAISGPEIDALLGAATGPGVDDGGPHDHVAWMVYGQFTSPNFLSARNGEHGEFKRNATRELHRRGKEDVYFTLWLPRGLSPAAALPVVLVQHGLGRDRSDALPLANALAGLGYATLAIDAPFHGLRASVDRNNRFTGEPTADGFGDEPGDFAGVADDQSELSPLHPFYYRDAMRQGVVDLMGAVAMLQQNDWSVLGPVPALQGVRLRTDRIAFVGFDIGAEMGIALASYEPSIGALVAAFAGGSTVDGWIDSPGKKPLMDALLQRLGRDPDASDADTEALLDEPDIDAWRTLADRGTALAYAPSLRRGPTNVLLLMAHDDEVVHNRDTEALAAALGADIAGSDPDFVLGLRVRALRPGATASSNFPIGDGAVTRMLYAIDSATHDALIREHDHKHFRAPLMRPFVERDEPLSVDNPIAETMDQIAFFFESYRACAVATPPTTCPAVLQAPTTSKYK